jgi:hypothetical protein
MWNSDLRGVRENSLTLAAIAIFAFTLLGQALAGWADYNDSQRDHGQAGVPLIAYIGSGHFEEAVFENWESEFLQMGALVLLTVSLRQKGSPESKRVDGIEDVDREPDPNREGAPWPVRAGGIVGKLYEHSLAIALLTLFVASFGLHVLTGAAAASADNLAHGGPVVSAADYLTSSRLWFESFQNWQSEFLSIAVLTVLSVFLRQRGSSESKPVDAPHFETSGEP